MRRIAFVLLFLMAFYESPSADVIDSGPNGCSISNKIVVPVPPETAYQSILNIGQWWSPAHTFFKDAKNLAIDPKAGGCFCEIQSATRQVRHGTVIYVDPGKTIRINTPLGLQDQPVTGVLTFHVNPKETGSEIEMTFGLGGYMQGGIDKIAPVVDGVLKEQIAGLKKYAGERRKNKE